MQLTCSSKSIFLGLLIALGVALSNAPVSAQTRFAYSPDGSEVTDMQSGLIWRRCSEGLIWDGAACKGGLRQFNHEEALAYAQTQTGWRLPNVKELSNLVDPSVVEYVRGSLIRPKIDTVVFPDTREYPYWTSTPYVINPSSAWTVDFGNGRMRVLPRIDNSASFLRLVR